MGSWSVSTAGGAEGGRRGQAMCGFSPSHHFFFKQILSAPPPDSSPYISVRGQNVNQRQPVSHHPWAQQGGQPDVSDNKLCLCTHKWDRRGSAPHKSSFTLFIFTSDKAKRETHSVTSSTLKLELVPECLQATRRCTHQTSLPSHVTQRVVNSVRVSTYETICLKQ